MRLNPTALLMIALAMGLAGCNDTLDSVVDPSTVKNKVEYQLPSRVLDEMKAKGMERNSPIAMRIFKEEGVLEIWKAKTNNRFDKIAEYQICAWSGRLGPKIKEGDRQAPEGFYPLSPYHLNPNSKYFLAINTGYPNRYDQANGRNGTNLMIHGACSSSGCYSMTDAQILEIYAFARDAFKGGQQTVQLQAFPFRMTADNMARHQHSPHYDFWKMLKVGYDNFEVTKRPPEVGVCDRKYVFNQQIEEGKTLSAAAACPPMTTPPALQMALASYNTQYERDFAKASRKYDGKIWYDPTEAERKALVAEMRKGHDLAYAPTGSALKAGKLLKIEEFEKLVAEKDAAAKPVAAPATTAASARPPAKAAEVAQTASVPVPQVNPLAPAPVAQAAEEPKKPFWKFWQK
ncbi:L,D-transpeptidase family protein [Ciceribacter ferrooxidans]|uniref:Murein L,D-transpeptidase n=1 Tax=Ciceribacter ferrooxidans TaxID=2509717 RepID=A0A4V1RN42_9HYPH|nr:murein L,D-transpeptidase family protein [Ciceribacter ferrooxidans]RYC04547.1 murein L,D-transpeptidase [Ciceribacter ferrooxidans]